MNSSPTAKEKLLSPAEIASMFEIPRSLVKILEQRVDDGSWGPLVPQGPDAILNVRLISKAMAEGRKALGANFGDCVNNSGDPAVSDPAQIVELSLDGYNLVSLGRAAAGCFPLGSLKKLRKLTLSNNRLTGDDSSEKSVNNTGSSNNNNNADNSLQTAVLAQLPELRELQLDHNLFTQFRPVNHGKLEILNLSGNDIRVMDVCSLPRLEYLDLSGNQHLALMTVCSKSKWQALVTLDISRCGLDSLQPLASAPSLQQHLRSLSASRNQLTTLQGIESLPGLEFIDASHNKLKHARIVGARGNINPLMSCAASLQELHLQDNNISTLAFFPAAGMKKLWKLLLSDNPLGGKQQQEEEGNEKENQSGKTKKRGGNNNNNNDNDDDDIGDAEYDDDSKSKAKLGSIMVQRGNLKANGAASSSSSKAAAASSVKRKSLQQQPDASARSTSSTLSVAAGGASDQQAACAPTTNRGIAAKLAALAPNVEVLDLGRTGVVTTKSELEAVCHELSTGCIYLRELDLPLPLGEQDASASLTTGAAAAAVAATSTAAVTRASVEESALVDFVVSNMKYLARFNGYVVRDDQQISVADQTRTVQQRKELGAALEELKGLEHLVDSDTMKMLRDFTVEASELQDGMDARERMKAKEKKEQQVILAGHDESGSGNNLMQLHRPVSRPGSAAAAAGAITSTIPKQQQRPVVRTSAFSKTLDAQGQRERDSAKTEFEAMLDEIQGSRHFIEATLEHVAGCLHDVVGADRDALALADPAVVKGSSPFKEVDAFRSKQLEKEQRQFEKEQQQAQQQQLREKFAAKAGPLNNMPPHPPPQSRAAASNAKLAEKITDDAARLRQSMAQTEQHVRSAVYPSATPFSSSTTVAFARQAGALSAASMASSSRTSIGGGGGATTPSTTAAAAAGSSTPLGRQRAGAATKTSTTTTTATGASVSKKLAGMASSSDDDDDTRMPPSAVNKTRGPGDANTLAQEVAKATRSAALAPRDEQPVRVSKWSNEKREPLSVRLAKIAESYNLVAESARAVPLSSSSATATPASPSPVAVKARPVSAGVGSEPVKITTASPQQQQQQQHLQPRAASAGIGAAAPAGVSSSASHVPVTTAATANATKQQQHKPIVSFTTSSLNVRRK